MHYRGFWEISIEFKRSLQESLEGFRVVLGVSLFSRVLRGFGELQGPSLEFKGSLRSPWRGFLRDFDAFWLISGYEYKSYL